jgi:hypothetical protein
MNAAIERFENPPEPETIHPNFDSVIRAVPEKEIPDEAEALLNEILEKYSAAVGEREVPDDEQKAVLAGIVDDLARERPHIRLALFEALAKFV